MAGWNGLLPWIPGVGDNGWNSCVNKINSCIVSGLDGIGSSYLFKSVHLALAGGNCCLKQCLPIG